VRVLNLPTLWTILLDALAWLILSPAISFLTLRLPADAFDPQGWLYATRRWEREGELWNVLFRVRRWKSALPSGGPALGGFSMRRFESTEPAYVRRWMAETCRAELAHWLQIALAPLFFLWNVPVAGAIIIVYALAANLPCIIVQRYNRPRVLRIQNEATPSAATH